MNLFASMNRKVLFFSLEINKSVGHVDISYNIFRKYFGELCTPLKHIFNLPFENGIFTNKLKIEKVTPTCKIGNGGDLSNHRPIFYASVFS